MISKSPSAGFQHGNIVKVSYWVKMVITFLVHRGIPLCIQPKITLRKKKNHFTLTLHSSRTSTFF